MEYIRTKNGIYRVLQWGSKRRHCLVIVVGLGSKVIDTSEIINQANSIEKLVDKYLRVFVGRDKEMKPYTMYAKNDGYFSKNESVVYACIWIGLPNGAYRLEPVAKLNDKGDLELL